MIKRTSLIVYFKSPKVLKMLGKIGEIYYYTKRNKYAVIYVNHDEKDSMIEEIRKLKLVKYVEESIFENNILLNEQEIESVK
ncbi:MAG: DUF2129 domain-containing protein [Candidatus Izemoplasmataceae bacterium]|mgnify:CR=1 FL=1